MRTLFLTLLLIILKSLPVISQPKYEIRATWLTTLGGMDWPRTKAGSATGIQRQKKELCDILDRLKAANFNTVLLQTRLRGDMIYPSSIETFAESLTGYTGRNPGYDPLAFAIEECHKRGMELHAWIVTIPAGNTRQVKLLGRNSIVQRNRKICKLYKGNWYLDPGNPETKEYLSRIVKEITSQYDIDGIHFDYIRYPVSDKAEDTGYTKYAMMEFAESVGITRLDESMSIDKMISEFNKWVLDDAYNLNAAENYEKWCDYRVNAVTSFVERVYEEVKGDGDLLLSTAVFSSASQTLDSKKQDWKTWIRNGWIDIATPMAYYDAAADVLSGVSDMILAAGANCYYYTGLASSYRGLPAYENVYQTEASYLGGANGYVIFCSTQIIGHEDVQEMLKAGVNSRPAVLPHASTEDVLKAYFDRILDRADRLYIPAEGMTTEGKTALKAEFDKILAMDMQGYDALKAVQTAVNNLYKSNNLSAYAKGFSARRIQETLTELYDLLETKAQKEYEGGDTPTPPDPGDSSTSSSENSGTETNPERKGCGSVVSACALSTVFAAGVALFLKKKRKI